MAITTDEKLAVIDGLVKKIFDDNGLGVFVDGHSKNRFRIDPSAVRSESREVFEKDVADQMLRFLQRKGMYARNKELMEGKSSFTTENVEKIGNAIRSANGLAGGKEKNVFSILGRDPKQPLGAVSERDYSDAAYSNGMSVDEIKRLVGDYRKQMGVDMSEARRLDTDANVKFDRVKMAGDFNQGKYDEGFLDWAARNGMKYITDTAYRKYLEQIKNGEGSDEILADAKDSFVNGDGRLRNALIDAGKDIAQLYGPKGAGKVLTGVPKVGPVVEKAAAGVGEKLSTTSIGNQVGSKGAYVLNPTYDAAVEAGSQVLEKGEVYDNDRVKSVFESSATKPLFATAIGSTLSNFPGKPRKVGREIMMGAKRGSSSEYTTRIDMRNDYSRIVDLDRQVGELSERMKTASGAERERLAGLLNVSKNKRDEAVNAFRQQYPNEGVDELLSSGTKPSGVGVKPSSEYGKKSLDENGQLADVKYTPAEEVILGYREPTSTLFGGVSGLVSPISQQNARAKLDQSRLEETISEEEKKRDEALKKAKEIYRKYNFQYPTLLADTQD